MTVGVVVPFRSQEEWRTTSARRVVEHLHSTFPGVELVLADDHGDTFSRGGSITAAALALDVDVILVCDADLLVPAAALREVVRLAQASPGLVIPFDRYLYLTAGETKRITTPPARPFPTRPRASWTMEGSVGGAGAFNRATLDITGGYPAVFRGWGFEDEAFALLADELAGPTRRVPADALHLYHPVDVTNNPHSPGYRRNMAALQSLIAARAGGADELRATLDHLAAQPA